MIRIFAVYFVFLPIIMAGCASTTPDPPSIFEEGVEGQDETQKDLEHKRNIEELELQQSEILEGLLEKETFAETLSAVADDSELYTNEEADESQLLAMTEVETQEVIQPEPAVTEVSPEEETQKPSLMELLEASFDKIVGSDISSKTTAQEEPQLPPTPSLPKELAVIVSPEQKPDPPIFVPESPLALSSARKLVPCSLVPELMDVHCPIR